MSTSHLPFKAPSAFVLFSKNRLMKAESAGGMAEALHELHPSLPEQWLTGNPPRFAGAVAYKLLLDRKGLRARSVPRGTLPDSC